jgi:hypothetical protein
MIRGTKNVKRKFLPAAGHTLEKALMNELAVRLPGPLSKTWPEKVFCFISNF